MATNENIDSVTTLQLLKVKPIPMLVAMRLLEREHYLHSLPGGTKLAFGVFLDGKLLGAIALGVGPINAHRLVEGATPDDCLTLTRLWLSDALPSNSESHTIAIVLRALRRYTNLKFLISYADPSRGHMGTIYQASGWLYIGLSDTTPLYDLGDGAIHNSRSLGYVYGSRSVRYLALQGVDVRLIPQVYKHRYVNLLEPSWISRLKVPVLPYPKKKEADESNRTTD